MIPSIKVFFKRFGGKSNRVTDMEIIYPLVQLYGD